MSPFEHLAAFHSRARMAAAAAVDAWNGHDALSRLVTVRIRLAVEQALVDFLTRERNQLQDENERLRKRLATVSTQGEQS